MAYSGNSLYEINVPDTPEVAERVEAFYGELGWDSFKTEDDRMITVVPPTGDLPVDGIGYWLDSSPYKTRWFEEHSEPAEDLGLKLSDHTIGLRLPRLNPLVEDRLDLPNISQIPKVAELGGKLLARHTYRPDDGEPYRYHAGRLEFRFMDPFLFGIRIATPKVAHLITV